MAGRRRRPKRRPRGLRRRPEGRRAERWGLALILLVVAILVWRGTWLSPPGPVDDVLPPTRFLPVYVRAGEMYHVPWQFLATINEIETRYDRIQPMISPVGALGPMQFMPATWAEYGRDMLHPGRRGDPMNFLDAVFACARLLHTWGLTPARTSPYWLARLAGSYDAGPGNWANGSEETTAYRANAVRLYALIRQDVAIPVMDLHYWNHLSLKQIGLIASGHRDGLAPGMPEIREWMKGD